MFVKDIEKDFCKIEIVFEPGIIPNFDESGQEHNFSWVSYSNFKKYNKLLNHYNMNCSLIHFRILLDQQEIYANSPKSTEVVIDQSILIDQSEPKKYQLEFESTGFLDQHMQLATPTTSVRAAIRLISLKIENIDVTAVFDDQCLFFDGARCSKGGLIFSSNTTATLDITTPIYNWLISNQILIIGKCQWNNL